MPGGRGKRVEDDEILSVFSNSPDPVLSTREVAEAVGLGRRGTLTRLNEFVDQGKLKKKKIDERRTIWWDPAVLAERYSAD